MKIISLVSLIILLLTSCGVSQTELDAANEKITELETKLALEKAKHNDLKTCEPASMTSQAESVIRPDIETQAATSNSKWTYSQQEDKMTGGTTYFASVTSLNTVNFSFPYNGEQNATLTLRSDPKYGKDVIFRIEKGQILCRSYDGCKVLVRFDNEKPKTYSASPPADNSTETIFISNYGNFLEKVRKAKIVRISPTIHQEGSPVFEFDINGFEVDRFKPKK